MTLKCTFEHNFIIFSHWIILSIVDNPKVEIFILCLKKSLEREKDELTNTTNSKRIFRKS